MTIDTEGLFLAKQKLHKFLAENPQLQEYQKEIEVALQKAKTAEQRMAVIAGMAAKNISKIAQEFTNIQKLTDKLTEKTNENLTDK
jgi:hypothetical protein